MAELFRFFNSIENDREYEAEEFAEYFRQFLTTGVYHKDGEVGLEVTHDSGLNINVAAGSAYIEGYLYINTDDLALAVAEGNLTNPRIDRIVVRLDLSAVKRDIRTVVKQGTPAANPQPPALQRELDIYEISLAQVRVEAGASTIANVKDERFDREVCGLVRSLITTPGARIFEDTVEPVEALEGDIWLKVLS